MPALDLDLSLPLRDFELTLALAVERTVALVGPSGAGKTSALRAIAGLVRARGRVALGDETWLGEGVDLRPEERRVGLVFQEYALFPHLSVRANVAYAGRVRVDELLERFRIAHLAAARPSELSGGERQRVALARALAREPAVLLLDEPLAALDAHTRAQVRSELHELLAELALPTLLVTHDFEDAATLADRVGVIRDGRILQTGTPTELVSLPNDAFVAAFTGAALLPGIAIESDDGLTRVALDGGLFLWSSDRATGPVNVAVYPWDVSVGLDTPVDSRMNHVRSPVVSMAPVGNRVRVRVGPVVAEITAASAERLDLRPGGMVTASFKATAARVFAR
jgi:ABC-type sulfate/molybdate transport systems ATPase subunit